MKLRLSVVCATAGLAGLAAALACHLARRPPAAVPAAGAPGVGQPTGFVPNLGQWRRPESHVARIGGSRVGAHGWGFTLAVGRRGGEVALRFLGARAVEPVAEERLAGVHHYFLGNDPARWRTDVPRFRQVRWPQPWPGVDVVVYEKDGHVEYDLVLAPGADLAAVEIAVDGSEGLALDERGALVLQTAGGRFVQDIPATYVVEAAGRQLPLVARHELRGADRFGFVVPGWDGRKALVIDPGIQWSTYLGGVENDGVYATSVDAAGIVTIAGFTHSADFPTSAGAWDAVRDGGGDAFVTRLDPSLPAAQQLVYSTFIGGSDYENANAISIAPSGVVTIAGLTRSTDYPTTANAWDRSFNGGPEVFVTQLDPSRPAAQQLVWSTYLGGNDGDVAFELAVDPAGLITVAGGTLSANYPTTPGAWDTLHGGNYDVFVTRMDPSRAAPQQILYSTFIGEGGFDWATALAVDAAGIVTIAGATSSSNYPTTAGAFDTSFNGSFFDAFVTRLDASRPAAQQVVYSTFLGGALLEEAHSLAVDAAGVVTVAGFTESANFPTTAGAWDTSYNGNRDTFVTRLRPDLPAAQQLVWSTFLGGTGPEEGLPAIAADDAGIVRIAGATTSADFPTTPGAWNLRPNGGEEAYVALFDPARPAARQLVYSTYLGGTSHERAWTISFQATGAVTVAGHTGSTDFPTTPGAWDTSHNSPNQGFDVFVTRLDLLPVGVTAFGRSSAGCGGPLPISVALVPSVTSRLFDVWCTGAPPLAAGVLLFGARALQPPVAMFGVELFVDPAQATLLGVQSDGLGRGLQALLLPPDASLVGARAFAQFVWQGPNSPPPCPPLGLSASNALDITIQR